MREKNRFLKFEYRGYTNPLHRKYFLVPSVHYLFTVFETPEPALVLLDIKLRRWMRDTRSSDLVWVESCTDCWLVLLNNQTQASVQCVVNGDQTVVACEDDTTEA